MSVNTAGILGGQIQVGHVTLTAPGAAGSPRIINVVLQMEGAPPKQLYVPLIEQ